MRLDPKDININLMWLSPTHETRPRRDQHRQHVPQHMRLYLEEIIDLIWSSPAHKARTRRNQNWSHVIVTDTWGSIWKRPLTLCGLMTILSIKMSKLTKQNEVPHLFLSKPRPDLVIVDFPTIYGLLLYNRSHMAPNQVQSRWPEAL